MIGVALAKIKKAKGVALLYLGGEDSNGHVNILSLKLLLDDSMEMSSWKTDE